MSPELREIARPFLERMHFKVKAAVVRRVDAMERELDFLMAKEDKRLMDIRRHGWSNDRLRVVFALNSVYQQVLGPLQAAARGGPEGLGKQVPVRHGTFAFSSATAVGVQRAIADFNKVVGELRISHGWLQANTCSDIVYLIAASNEWR